MNKEISRREFLKLSGITGLSLLSIAADRNPMGNFIDRLILNQTKDYQSEYLQVRKITASQAAKYAQSVFGKEPYKFGIRDCAMFSAQFASYYGIPLERDITSPTNYDPKPPEEYLPDATTVKQVKWFEKANSFLKSDLIIYPKNAEIAKEEFWKNIADGSLVYLRTEGESQHGYDQYSHTAAFIGLDENQHPIFAEYAPIMQRGPETKRTLGQLLSMYRGKIPENLTACIVNVPEMAVKLWKERDEKVIPNSKTLLKAGYQEFLTVNINSGVATYWKKENGEIRQKPFANGDLELFSATGRNLLPRTTLTTKYQDFINGKGNTTTNPFSSYSILKKGTACFYGTPLLVPRFYLTPPLIFELQDFAWVANFGNLGGATDIALINTLYLNSSGSISKVETRSDYTIHATPQRTRTQQDLLLRDKILNEANRKKKAPSPDLIHLTSGCVNFTPEVFEVVKKTINPKTAIIFSYPDFPQDLQLANGGFSLAKDPLGGLSHMWGYTEI